MPLGLIFLFFFIQIKTFPSQADAEKVQSSPEIQCLMLKSSQRKTHRSFASFIPVNAEKQPPQQKIN